MWFRKDKPKLSESFWNWLMGQDKSSQDLNSVALTVEVRRRIIKALKQGGVLNDSPLLGRVVNARDLETLWHLRPEIMRELSSLHGETQARNIMSRKITPLFAGLLPKGLFRRSGIAK